MMKSVICIWFAVLAASPGMAAAQAIVASAAMPRPADSGVAEELAVADGPMPQVAGNRPADDESAGTGVASAGTLALQDVQLVYTPPPSQYRPEGAANDAPPEPVRVACVVGTDGHMQNCAVGDTSADPNMTALALNDVSQFVVAPRSQTGDAVAGQTLVVTCQFQPVDDGRKNLASN